MIVAAFEGFGFDVEAQAGFLLFLAVAFQAVLFQDRPHLTHEIDRRGESGSGEQGEKQADERHKSFTGMQRTLFTPNTPAGE